MLAISESGERIVPKSAFATEEIIMPKCRSILTVTAISMAGLFAAPDMASAQKSKKMSYEQAYEKCRMEIGPGTDANAGPSRYTRGSACMKKYGYRLKK